MLNFSKMNPNDWRKNRPGEEEGRGKGWGSPPMTGDELSTKLTRVAQFTPVALIHWAARPMYQTCISMD